MLDGEVFLPIERLLHSLFPLGHFGCILRRSFAGIQKSIGEYYLVFSCICSDCPLFRLNESAFCQLQVECVELIDESLIDFCAFPPRIEVLEGFVDVPLVSA